MKFWNQRRKNKRENLEKTSVSMDIMARLGDSRFCKLRQPRGGGNEGKETKREKPQKENKQYKRERVRKEKKRGGGERTSFQSQSEDGR